MIATSPQPAWWNGGSCPVLAARTPLPSMNLVSSVAAGKGILLCEHQPSGLAPDLKVQAEVSNFGGNCRSRSIQQCLSESARNRFSHCDRELLAGFRHRTEGVKSTSFADLLP
jgi:hypothetical protein